MVVLLYIYINDFCYYINCLYTTGTGTALRKNRSMRVPVQYSISIVYIVSRPGLRFESANQVGLGSGA